MEKEELLKLLNIVKLSDPLELNLNCSKCGKPLKRKTTTGTQIKYQLKKKGPDFFLCHKCLSQRTWENKSDEELTKIANSKKDAWLNKSEEELNNISNQRSQTSKKVWDNRTQEEKDAIKNKILTTKENWTVEEKQQAITKMVETKKNWSESKKEDFSKRMSQLNLEFWKGIGVEERLERSNLIKEGLSNMSEDSKSEKGSKTSKALKKYWTADRRLEQSIKVSEFWEPLSKEEKDSINLKRVNSLLKFWESLTDERRSQISEKHKLYWKNLSEKEKEEFSKRSSEINKTYWNSLSEDIKELRILKNSESLKTYWASLPEEDKQLKLRPFLEGGLSFWQTCSNEQRLEIRRKSNKKGKYKSQDGETFDSSWELSYYEYCKDQGFNIKREPVGLVYEYQGKTHTYYPDFEVNGILIEVKGNNLKDKDGKWINCFDRTQDGLYEAKRQCALRNNVQILYQEDLVKLGIQF